MLKGIDLAKVLGYVISLIIRQLSPEQLRKFADNILDFVENKIVASETELDDKLLPLLAQIRLAFWIEDNDKPVE